MLFVGLILTGCAKTLTTSDNADAQRFYNAWVAVQKVENPDYLWRPFSYGTTVNGEDSDYAYILEEVEGSGVEVEDSVYVFLNYTSTDLYGNVNGTTDKTIAWRTGVDYDPSYYYGPTIWYSADGYINTPLRDLFTGYKNGEECWGRMKVGGTRKVVIPGWLMSTVRYDTADEYLENSSGDDVIYEITVTDVTDDIFQYQIDSIEAYAYRHYRIKDSTYYGFYYKSLSDPIYDDTYPDDTTIYINYIGRLLNGTVFDTNIADTAKVWNLYDSSNDYEPMEVNWSSDSTAVTLDSSTPITGFASMIIRMSYFESAVGIFYSELGYSSSGSGNAIPAYAPLEFEIRIVEGTDDDD